MKKLLTALVAIGILALAICSWRYYVANRGFTPWMDNQQMDAFMKSLDGDRPGGKNYFDRGHWITAVEGRWHDGKPEHRIRYADTPKDVNHLYWYWWLNANQQEWAGHVEHYADDGFTLVHYSSYLRPDGRMIYDGVWHKVD
jgi:hypothetical protein